MMVFRVLSWLAIALLVGFGASWLSGQEGMTTITWLGHRAEVQSSFLVVAILSLCVAGILVDRIIRALIRWPSLFSAGWQARRRAKGETALSLGFVALAAGDNRAARKQAKRAEKLLERGVLTDLLVAQSSYAAGDATAAARYFKKLAAEKQTAYFGQLGLMRLYQSQQKNDKDIADNALLAAQKAFALDPTSAEAAHFILQKALADRHWQQALSCLQVYMSEATSRETADLAGAKDLYVRLMTQLASEAETQKQTISYAQQALRERADFAPAAALLCEALQAKGDQKGALKVAEKAFRSFPHPFSLDVLRGLRAENDGQFISYVAKLASKSERPDEGYLAVADFAITSGIWASASQMLSQISDRFVRHNHYYMIKAAIAKGIDDEAAHQEALQQAAMAPRAGQWRCQSCASVFEAYHFDCAHCHANGQIIWHWPLQQGAALTPVG